MCSHVIITKIDGRPFLILDDFFIDKNNFIIYLSLSHFFPIVTAFVVIKQKKL